MVKTEKKIVCAVIVAAGSGSRMNMDVNKQFLNIDGIPILARTVQCFNDCSMVDEIILVVNQSDIVYCKKSIVDAYGFSKVKSLVSGGSERQESVYKGLVQLSSASDIVLIHDGVRPFINEESIIDSIRAAEEFGAACVAVPVKDTIKSSDKDNFVKITLERSELWSIQTPQTFKYEIIMKAHKNAAEAGFTGTDDAMLVERLGYGIKLVKGSYFNIKITTKEDLVLAEAIVKSRL